MVLGDLWGGHSAGSGQAALAGPTWGPSLSGGLPWDPEGQKEGQKEENTDWQLHVFLVEMCGCENDWIS